MACLKLRHLFFFFSTLLMADSPRQTRQPGKIQFPKTFPEESPKKRIRWDTFCQDRNEFPYQDQIPIRSHIEFFSHKKNGFLKGLAVGRLLPRAGADPNKLVEEVKTIFLGYDQFPKWILPGINEKDPPGEGSYFVTLDGLEVVINPKNKTEAVFSGPYTFSMLGFSRSGFTSVFSKEYRDQLPVCLRSDLGFKNEVAHIFFRMSPRAEILTLLAGDVIIVEKNRNNKTWVEFYVRVVSELSPLVYNLMPDALVQNEMKQRVQRIFLNLLERRSSLAKIQ